MSREPSTTGPDGRDSLGRFAKGNRLSKGNPLAKKVARLRAGLLEAVGPDDVAAVAKRLVALAKGGDVQAARVLLDRLLGPAVPLDLLEEIETLKREMEGLTGDRTR